MRAKNVGGVGGGLKYACGGIFFKFCVDEYGLYGGNHWAAKAAKVCFLFYFIINYISNLIVFLFVLKHELRGLALYMNYSMRFVSIINLKNNFPYIKTIKP